MNTKKIIHLALIIISALGFYFFYFNSQLLIEYKSNNSKRINGKLESYNLDKSGRTPYFTFKLEEFNNLFSVPIPEWKSFDFSSFERMVNINDSIFVVIPSESKLNQKNICVLQIEKNEQEFINFDKKIMLREIDKWLALAFGVFGLIGNYLHYKKPWI